MYTYTCVPFSVFENIICICTGITFFYDDFKNVYIARERRRKKFNWVDGKILPTVKKEAFL